MTEIAQKYQDELERIKKNIENSYNWFKENYKNFNRTMSYLFKTQLTKEYKKLLTDLNKPSLEFNVLEAFISKLCGEFSDQEPSLKVSNDFNAPTNSKVINVVEGHLRHILDNARKDNTLYRTFRNTTAGGFSVLKVWTEYAHPMSMDQVIKFGEVYSPTLTFFDPNARQPHKGDGNFCGEIFPVTEDDFEREYPDIDIKKIGRSAYLGDFKWGYLNNSNKKIILKCHYYEKKKKRIRIVQLVKSRFGEGIVIPMDQYKELSENWDNLGFPEPLPAILGKPRWTDIETIVRYTIIETQILKREETDYTIFPLIFADGNSEIIQDDDNTIHQLTRSYIKNAKGMQDLMNFAGNTMGQELSNIIQHQFTIAEEALPKQTKYKEAYQDTQHADLLVYRAYSDKEITKPLPPPTVVQRQAIPPQISETFINAPQTVQVSLGAYDASIVNTQNPILSGKAIVQGNKAANAASKPYLVNIICSLNRVLECCLSLIPKYYITPRTIPVIDADGKRSAQLINVQGNPQSINMQYDDNVLQVSVEAGPSFAIQQDEALMQVMSLANSMPGFADFIQKKGLKYIIDCLHIKGIDQLKELVTVYQSEMEQQQKQMMQMQQQSVMNNPAMQKLQLEKEKIASHERVEDAYTQLETAKVAVSQQKMENEKLKTMADISNANVEAQIKIDSHQTEKARIAADMAINASKELHAQNISTHKIGHEITKTILDHHHKQQQLNKEETTE